MENVPISSLSGWTMSVLCTTILLWFNTYWLMSCSWVSHLVSVFQFHCWTIAIWTTQRILFNCWLRVFSKCRVFYFAKLKVSDIMFQVSFNKNKWLRLKVSRKKLQLSWNLQFKSLAGLNKHRWRNCGCQNNGCRNCGMYTHESRGPHGSKAFIRVYVSAYVLYVRTIGLHVEPKRLKLQSSNWLQEYSMMSPD